MSGVQREISFDTITPFIDALLSAGIRTAVAAVIDEKRTVETSPGVLCVQNVNTADFIAYGNATLFKLTVRDKMISKAEEILCAHGISVSRRSRNITR